MSCHAENDAFDGPPQTNRADGDVFRSALRLGAHGGGPSSNPNSDHESLATLDDNEAHGNAGGEGNSSRPSVRVVESQGVDLGSLGTEMLTIEVDRHGRVQTYGIHADLICARSALFAASFDGSRDVRVIGLPPFDHRTYNLYFQLVYTGRLPSKPDDSANADEDEFTLLCELYSLAYIIKDVGAANGALDAMFAKAFESATLPSCEQVSIIYKNTEGPCGGRRMVVNLYANGATGEWMETQAEGDQGQGFPREFLGELVMSLVTMRAVPGQFMRGRTAQEYYDGEEDL